MQTVFSAQRSLSKLNTQSWMLSAEVKDRYFSDPHIPLYFYARPLHFHWLVGTMNSSADESAERLGAVSSFCYCAHMTPLTCRMIICYCGNLSPAWFCQLKRWFSRRKCIQKQPYAASNCQKFNAFMVSAVAKYEWRRISDSAQPAG